MVPASAVTVHTATLGWNAVPETGIQGYRIYVGTVSQQYTQVVDAGTSLSFPVANLEFGKTYYFAVKSIGSAGQESAPSAELAVTIAPPPLPLGGGISINGSGQRGLNWTFPKSSLGSSPEFIVEASPDLVQWTEVDTVLPAESTGGTTQTAQFSWPITISGDRMFYRLTARNWMGSATAP